MWKSQRITLDPESCQLDFPREVKRVNAHKEEWKQFFQVNTDIKTMSKSGLTLFEIKTLFFIFSPIRDKSDAALCGV